MSMDFTNVASGTTLAMDTGNSGTVTVALAGAASTAGLSLGTAASAQLGFATLTFTNGTTGVSTLNVVNNGPNIAAGTSTAAFNTITNLKDNGLSTLNFSGTQGLLVTTHNQTANQATSITINNTNSSSYGLNIDTLTDSALTSLSFTGTGLSRVGSLTASAVTTLTLGNTGTQAAVVGSASGSNWSGLTTLTLNGDVQIGTGLSTGPTMSLTSANSITVAGSTDNASVKLALGVAAAGQTHTINLGNGNNTISDNTVAGTVNLTLGTGSNALTIGSATANTTGAFNITVGAGSGPDYITVGNGGNNYLTAANYTISGAQTGDRIYFRADTASVAAGALTSTGDTTVAALVASVKGLVNTVRYTQFGGDTYVAESKTAADAIGDETVVKIVGTHTLTAGLGYVELAS